MNRSLKFLIMSFSLSYLLGTGLSQAQTTNQINSISDWQNLQGKWTLSEGGNAEIDFSQGEPVLKAFGRTYKMYNYRPQKGFSITFKPTTIQEFKNNQLPDAVRQELINKNYQQYGSVDILDSQHLSVKIFLDEATYEVEDPGEGFIGIKNVGPKRTGQFTLNRDKTVDLVGYSFWFDPENNQKIIDQIQAKESELLEVTKKLDELVAEKARYASVITKLNLDLTQAQTKLSEKVLDRKALSTDAIDKLAQLDQQILSLKNQIKSLEASLKNTQLTPDALKNVQQNIQPIQQQLLGLTQKRDLYNAHKPPSSSSETRVLLDTETADLALFIKSAKERLNGLFDEEGQTAEKIEAAYLKRSDIVHQTLPLWEDLVNHTPPFDEEIQIFLDNDRVYQKNFKEDLDLASMNQALAQLEKAMDEAKEKQKSWLQLALDAANKADIAANALAGENKTYWQRYFGNGYISKTAQGNAAIDFSVDLAEMAYEGAQEGGIGGVISEGLKKVLVNGTNVIIDELMDRTDTSFESLNTMSSDVQARI
ncbi:MAG: hypothetical protein K2X66_16595, partial [Cyanobacteria bacterium]|nr:hypothetical protein [Cyanobacteriota bacterium]